MLRIILLGLLLAGAGSAAPNVLLIYTDDHGSVDAGCYGSKDLFTPNMDKLAKAGVRFTQMLAPSAICTASRAGLLTGNFPPRVGLAGNAGTKRGTHGLNPKHYIMPELFRDAGYRTHHVGKWHLGYTEEDMPNAQGFDSSWGHMGGCIDNYSHFYYWSGPNEHDLWRDGKEIWEDGVNFGQGMVREVKVALDQKSEKPFFIYWAINWPHYPLQGYDHWRKYYDEKGLEHPRAKYAAFLSSMDEIIGEVIDHLDAQGLREETIILLQSDHGHSVEERTFGGGGDPGPYRGHKGSFFEGGLRVPSIISWPGKLPQGEVRDAFVTGCDWFPTLAELAGAGIPAGLHLDGVSMVDVIKDASVKTPHDSWLWSFGAQSHWAVRQGDWKLIYKPRDQRNPGSLVKGQNWFLVNLAEDIGEAKNVADAFPEKLAALKQLQAEYEASIKASLASPLGQ
ncbi:MAG: arylsulfatase A [Kiritimatiellia bacterium]|jgi:arylsulfatase A